METILRRCWKSIIWWHSVIYRKQRYFELIGPYSSVALSRMACQAHETPAMHVNHYVIDLTVFLPSISFFILAQKRQFFVVENSYGY